MPSDEARRLEELKAKAEAKRRQVEAEREEIAQTSPKTASRPEVETRSEQRTCTECTAEFEAQVTDLTLNGEVRSFGARLCPKCWGAEVAGLTPPRQRIVDLKEALEAVGVNVRRHGHLTLADLGEQPAVREARAFVGSLIRAGRWGEVDGLYLHGSTGTGKSQIAAAIARAVIDAGVSAQRIVYDRARALIQQVQDCYTTGQVDAFTARRGKALLYVYEDAGTEKLTADAYRVMEDIFDRREGHPTIVTSNLTRAQLSQRWQAFDAEGRLHSRLAPFRAVEVVGPDRRFAA